MNATSRNILLFLLSTLVSLGIATVGLVAYRFVKGEPVLPDAGTATQVLGDTSVLSPIADAVKVPVRTITGAPRPDRAATGAPAAANVPTAAPAAPAVSFVDFPQQVTEGDQITFTWYVDGPPQDIGTTSVYFGSTSTPGELGAAVPPDQTHYDQSVPDFMHGTYRIPLRFIASVQAPTTGEHYARAYAAIGSKHYWSEERTFTVVAKPVNGIHVVSYPAAVKAGENVSFTWDVTGPPGKTGYTTIVAGTTSKPGPLGYTVSIPQTPYAEIIPDFTTGSFDVPLRFVGNIRISTPGTYYFRALVFVDGRNIWSDEYSLTVQ